MTEFFEFIKHLETSSSASAPREIPIHRTPLRDKAFKTVILTLLFLSITIQVLASAWLYDKFRILQDHLSLYPVAKPVEVDLSVTLPELVEVDQKIDMFTHELDRELETQQAVLVPEGNTRAEAPSTPVRKKPRSHKTNQVQVVEEIKN